MKYPLSNGAGVLIVAAVIFLLMPTLISPVMGLESTVTNTGNAVNVVEVDRSSVLADILTAEEEKDRNLTDPDQFTRTYFQGESVSSSSKTYASVYVSNNKTLTTLTSKSQIVVPIPASIDCFVIHVKFNSSSSVLDFWNKFIQKTDAAFADTMAHSVTESLTYYMTVNENSNELPLEGFALCPNCGDHLKTGWFIKNEDGFSLTENNKAAASLQEERPKQSEVSGGHYRVRKAGPNRGRLNGHFTY